MAVSLSTIFAAVQANFNQLFVATPTLAAAPPFYFGPEWIGQQSGPAQVVAFPTRDRFDGPEIHANPPATPRELRRAWTQVAWMLWAPWPPLSPWSGGATVAQGALGIPSAGNATGLYYAATTGGVAGLTEPSWPTTIGGTVDDGSIVWTATATTTAYSVSKTDNIEAIRAPLIQAIHAASVGAYHLVHGDWYRESDQFAMAGALYVLTTEFWIPMVDAVEGTALVTKTPITPKLVAA